MADIQEATNLTVGATGDAVIAAVPPTKTGKSQAVTVDPTTLPVAENMPAPFASDRSVPGDTLLTDADRKAADESGRETDDNKKESHLYKEAVLRFSEATHAVGAIESEFDDGTVDIMTTAGRWTRLPLQTKDNKGVLAYPYVEMGKA